MAIIEASRRCPSFVDRGTLCQAARPIILMSPPGAMTPPRLWQNVARRRLPLYRPSRLSGGEMNIRAYGDRARPRAARVIRGGWPLYQGEADGANEASTRRCLSRVGEGHIVSRAATQQQSSGRGIRSKNFTS